MFRIKWYCKKQVTMISFHKDRTNRAVCLLLDIKITPHGAQISVIFSFVIKIHQFNIYVPFGVGWLVMSVVSLASEGENKVKFPHFKEFYTNRSH